MKRYITGAAIALAMLVLSAGPSAAQNAGGVTGTVVDQDGEPVQGVEVRIVSLSRVTRTDAEGSFSFVDVPAGGWVLDAFSDRWGRTTERVNVEQGSSASVTLELDPVFHVEQVLVTAGPEALRRSELYQAADVLGDRELRSRLEATLGQTLRNQPGVHASYHGPASSRPVVRGLGGDRVRVLEGGIGTGDAASTSPDHAVGVEPQLAERIEVLRGPATLLYGSSAIGGVVNVIDGRIPTELPSQRVTGSLIGVLGTVADERNTSAELTGRTGRIAWHASGLLRETDDYAIPGFAEADHEDESETGDEEAVEGVLGNSALSTQSGSAGLSWVGSNGYVGASFTGYFTEYGVPGGHHEEEGEEHEGEEEEEETVVVDLDQRRVDLEGMWRFTGNVLRGLKGRFGIADYEHRELEGDAVGTTFRNDSWEGRLEAQHRLGDAVHGAVGAQLMRRDFEAIGEEAFVPPTETRTYALFLFEELDHGPWRYQLGARFERQTAEDRTNAFERSFNGYSVSAGVNFAASEAVSLALHGARSVKAPNAEELFSNGPHLATRSFELGDPNLDREAGYSIDLTARASEGRLTGELTGFLNRFDDFIYQQGTGEEEDGLPVLRFTQGDALFVGFEGRAELELLHDRSSHLLWELTGDWVRAELTATDEPLPRIPPLRFGTGFRYERGPLGARVHVRRTARQNRLAAFEEATAGYTMIDASVNYRLFTGGVLHEIILTGNNLGDAEARNHVSLLKDFAPLPGREIRLMYRLGF